MNTNLPLEEIVAQEYGIGALHASGTAAHAVLWAADMIGDTIRAKAELTRVNRARDERGLVFVMPVIGHRLF